MRPYGIASGGENVDDVVMLSAHASWNSVHDFHAKNAQKTSVRMSTTTTRTRLTAAGSTLEIASMPTWPRSDCTHAPHRNTHAMMAKTATSSCQSVAAFNR